MNNRQIAHTPGPWKVVENVNLVKVIFQPGDGLHSTVAQCFDNAICNEHGGTALANARLIAAVPELLEACVSVMQDWQDEGDIDASTITAIQAAITKARGTT